MRIETRYIAAITMGMAFALNGLANIGVVDMDRLIKLHPRTKTDKAILEQYVSDFESERDEKITTIKKETAELEELSKAVDDISLSEKAREEKKTLAKAKEIDIRKLDSDLRDLATNRQKQLTSEELRMRRRVVSDISKIVAEVAKKKNLELVLDSTGMGVGGYNQVIFSEEKNDITDDVIAKMPKDKDLQAK